MIDSGDYALSDHVIDSDGVLEGCPHPRGQNSLASASNKTAVVFEASGNFEYILADWN